MEGMGNRKYRKGRDIEDQRKEEKEREEEDKKKGATGITLM